MLTPGRNLRGVDRIRVGQLTNVRSGNERPSGACDDQSAYVIALPGFLDRAPELGDGGVVEGVELVGTIDGEGSDPVVYREAKKLVIHGARVEVVRESL